MQPVAFEGAIEIKKPSNMTDEECMSIWATQDVDDVGYHFFLTAWKPSYEDIQAIMSGRPIFVKTLSNRLPPMALFTLDDNGQHNDAG